MVLPNTVGIGIKRSSRPEASLPSHICMWSSGTCSWSSGYREGCWQRPGWHPGSDASSNKQNQRNSMWWLGTQAHENTCSVGGGGNISRESQGQLIPDRIRKSAGPCVSWGLPCTGPELPRGCPHFGARGSECRLYHLLLIKLCSLRTPFS